MYVPLVTSALHVQHVSDTHQTKPSRGDKEKNHKTVSKIIWHDHVKPEAQQQKEQELEFTFSAAVSQIKMWTSVSACQSLLFA